MDPPNSSRHPSFYLGIPAPVSWWLVRHFALILNLKKDELDAALFSETRCASSLNESCDCDVENELLPELADNPGKLALR